MNRKEIMIIMTNWYDLENLNKNVKKYNSQAGEDGLIEYIFNNIGTDSKYCVEIGAGQIKNTPNCKYFMDNGWDGIMFERIKKKNPSEIREQYNIRKEAISDKNINEVLLKYNVPENVDFISLDIDGQDYYVWKAMKFRPKVFLVEFNEGLDSEVNKVMNYDPEHYRHRDKTYYYGASIKAFKNLGIEKGYTLLCKVGRNLVFILDKLLPEKIDRDVKIIHPISIQEPYKCEDKLGRKWIEL